MIQLAKCPAKSGQHNPAINARIIAATCRNKIYEIAKTERGKRLAVA
jgi:hypothetical protein